MQYVKGAFRWYIGITLYVAMPITMGYTLRKTTHWPYKHKVWEMADNVSKALLWPVTGPGAIQKWYEESEFHPRNKERD